MLTRRFDDALVFARQCHEGQTRNGTDIPYISHPMAVASLVLEHGGDEDETIAALLHDVLEDVGPQAAGEIESKFGKNVLSIVRECSDCEVPQGKAKPPWKTRKETYISQIKHKSKGALLVTSCDKLHNLTSIVRDYDEIGDRVWGRFSSDRESVKWYYQSLAQEFKRQHIGIAVHMDALIKKLP